MPNTTDMNTPITTPLSSDITLDTTINAAADEGFVNHPRIAMEPQPMAASGMSAYWTRGVDIATPYIKTVRTQVAANPWIGVGVAAGAFLTIGYFVARRMNKQRVLADRNDFYSPNYAPTFSSRNSADFYGSTEAGLSNTVGVGIDTSAKY